MNNRLTQKAKEALEEAVRLAQTLGHTYVGSEHLLYGLTAIEDSIAARFLYSKAILAEGIYQAIVKQNRTNEKSKVTSKDMTPRLKQMIENAGMQAKKRQILKVGTEHFLLAILEERESSANRIITNFPVSLAELRTDLVLLLDSTALAKPEKETKAEGKGNAESVLELYGKDLTELARTDKLDPVIGREEESSRCIRILSRKSKNNPCLVGDPGVGKTAIVEGLASRIVRGEIPDNLKNRRIISLDLSSLVAGAKYRGEFEERLRNVVAEVKAHPEMILFIDEVHTIVGAGAAEGAVDAANILKPLLSRGEIRLIGATTLREYRRYIEKDTALERRFQPVVVEEPTSEDTRAILYGLRPRYEKHHGLRIEDEAIESAITLSKRYMPDRFLPDKAIDLLDEACASLCVEQNTPSEREQSLQREIQILHERKNEAIRSQNFEGAAHMRDEEELLKAKYNGEAKKRSGELKKKNSVTKALVSRVLTERTGISISTLNQSESDALNRLESKITDVIIGQNKAVEAVCRAVRRGRLGLKDNNRPIGTFLFLGATGVGKTALAKTLAETLFGETRAFLRFDMSEYMESHSVAKLIGAPPGYVGYEEGGRLTEAVRSHPRAVILFDEIEKAHADIANLLLQITEEGVLTDAQGKVARFSEAVVILTSNAGGFSEVKGNQVGFLSMPLLEETSEKAVKDALGKVFRPELLNRFDEIIVFHELQKEDIKKILRNMLAEAEKRAILAGYAITLGEDVVDFCMTQGYNPKYGARPLRRMITTLVEDALSLAIIQKEVVQGVAYVGKVSDGKIIYTQKNKTLLPV